MAQYYLAKGPRHRVGAEQNTEAAGGTILPAVGPSPDGGQGATHLSQRVRGWNVGLPQELSHVLPPSRLTLHGTEDTRNSYDVLRKGQYRKRKNGRLV